MTRRRKKPAYGKQVYYILCIIAVLVSVVLSIWGPGGLKELKRAHRELQERRLRIEELNRSNNERLQAVEALKHDAAAQERYARQKGYARPGEIIQQLPEAPPTPER